MSVPPTATNATATLAETLTTTGGSATADSDEEAFSDVVRAALLDLHLMPEMQVRVPRLERPVAGTNSV